MEDFSKTISTQASGFHGLKLKNQLNSPKASPIFAEPNRAGNYEIQQNEDQYIILSGKAVALANQIQKLRELNKRILEDKSIEQAQESNLIKYQQTHNINRETEKEVKAKINQQTAKIEKEIQELFKVRTAVFKESDRNIKDLIQDLKELKDKCFLDANKHTGTKLSELRNKVGTLRKDTVAYKKQNALFKQDIFAALNSVRAKLHSQVNQEEIKRKSCNEMVENLLQKSCTKAQQSLRRRLY